MTDLQGLAPVPSLEKFELLRRRRCIRSLFSPKNTHPFELLVGEGENAHFPIMRYHPLDASHVHHCILLARAVTYIDRVLHLRKSVLEQSLSELNVVFPRPLSIYRQVKHRQDPHTTIPADLHLRRFQTIWPKVFPYPSKPFGISNVFDWP